MLGVREPAIYGKITY
ncbi:MAG: hypothetical protein RR675_02095, partial [Oscillospiraceae bacterium]